MIFVSVGTHPQPFMRLLDEVASLVDRKVIRETVVVQAGNTPFTHPRMRISSFMDIASFEKTLGECSLFITHAGEGNIGTALQMGKPLIIMPRLHSKGEHTDDHQLELATAIGKRGDAVVTDSLDGWKTLVKEALEKAKNRRVSEQGDILRILEKEYVSRGLGVSLRRAEKSPIPQSATIIVATLNGGAPLVRAVNGMLKQEFDGKFEIVVVDDGSYDGKTPELLKINFAKNPHVTLVFLPRSGVCKARNAGIRAAKHEVVINMDHDCIPQKNWLQTMVNGFDSPSVGAVSAYGHYGGTSTGFRKYILDHLSGYDEDFFYYREDTDLSFRIMELGYEYKRVPAASKMYTEDRTLVSPKGIQAILKYTRQRLKYHMNDVLLHKKHPSPLCEEFLHVKWKLFVDPVEDFKVATGLWKNPEAELELSSPRGLMFMEGKSVLYFPLMIAAGLGYMMAIKIARLAGSLKHGHWLV
jgi:UDP-N-acetylglucosamine transferase subunit ALG13/GT2 family glycosyltransferase